MLNQLINGLAAGVGRVPLDADGHEGEGAAEDGHWLYDGWSTSMYVMFTSSLLTIRYGFFTYD